MPTFSMPVAVSAAVVAPWEARAAPVAAEVRAATTASTPWSLMGLGLSAVGRTAVAAHSPFFLYLNAACGRATEEPAPHRPPRLLVPAPRPKTT